jgi:hypothetical protein
MQLLSTKQSDFIFEGFRLLISAQRMDNLTETCVAFLSPSRECLDSTVN